MTTRIACPCPTCRTNATKLGRPFPLAADVSDRILAQVGTTPSTIHRIVYTVHDPFMQRAVDTGHAYPIGTPVTN